MQRTGTERGQAVPAMKMVGKRMDHPCSEQGGKEARLLLQGRGTERGWTTPAANREEKRPD